MRPAGPLLGALLAVIAIGPASTRAGAAPGPPRVHNHSNAYDVIDNSVIRPATRALDLPRGVRRLRHDPLEAADVDASDQVRLPSTWWQPRIGFREITPEQMLHGPGPGTGPAPGTWRVTSAKSQGVTPGFQILDARGVKYLIKLDTPEFPGAATAADVIGSYLFWAAGYNVPENTIEGFTRDDLVIEPDATYADEHGHRKHLTDAYLDGLLARVAPPVNGRYRCMASRYLSGKPLGPFEYQGRRKDDPDDLVPHERRRELRGLWTVAAWLNHADSRGANSLDMWVTEDGRSFVRHYLVDFGSILGSTATSVERDYSNGSEYYIDYGVMARQLLTLGLYRPKWESVVDPRLPSVGFVESKVFDPATWRPDYPNPAYDARTDRDARWGARIVAGFTNEHIRAAVAAGRLPDPRAEDYLVRVLIERRDKLMKYWLNESPAPERLPARIAAGRAASARAATAAASLPSARRTVHRVNP